MHRNLRYRSGTLAALLLAVLALAACRSEEPEQEAIIGVDTAEATGTPGDEVVGLCAVNRQSGTLEGRIVRRIERDTLEGMWYRVEPLQEQGTAFEVKAEAVHLDTCERAVGLEPDGSPIRVERERQ
jgi:hypothetical protein